MKDPATAEIWQTAFGKEFGGMDQGDNKTVQKGRNAIFVMNHNNITKVLKAGKKFTYANPVVDHVHKKKTQIGSELLQVETSLKAPANYRCQQQTLTQKNYIGIVW
jgi:hypothetical protein